MGTELTPAVIVRPGEILKRELEERGWTQADLAAVMGRPEQAVSEIVNGKKQITAETAIELGLALGTSAKLWSNLEANYQLDLARTRVRPGPISARRRLYQVLPVREMAKRGWIHFSSEGSEVEESILRFLGVSSMEEPPSLIASFHQSTLRQPNSSAQLAWLRRVEEIALGRQVRRFDRRRLERSVPELLELCPMPQSVSLVPDVLAVLGVNFVLLPHLAGTYLDGAAFYLQGMPVIALTLRYDRLDAFWFTLLHEIAHIVEGQEMAYLDDLSGETADDPHIDVHGGGADDAEAGANRAARDWLIDPTAFSAFVAQAGSRLTRAKIELFAKEQGRHPAIVIGRLQHEGILPFSRYRGLLVKVSPFLASAIAA